MPSAERSHLDVFCHHPRRQARAADAADRPWILGTAEAFRKVLIGMQVKPADSLRGQQAAVGAGIENQGCRLLIDQGIDQLMAGR